VGREGQLYGLIIYFMERKLFGTNCVSCGKREHQKKSFFLLALKELLVLSFSTIEKDQSTPLSPQVIIGADETLKR